MIGNFLPGKYHIKTVENINLFQVNIFMPVTKFPFLTFFFPFFAKGGRSLISLGDFSKKLTAKIVNIESCIEKNKERKSKYLR